MGDAIPPPDNMMGSQLDVSVDLDLVDELLGGDWFEIPDCSDLLHQGVSSSAGPFDPYNFSTLLEFGKSSSSSENVENDNRGGPERSDFSPSSSSVKIQIEELSENQLLRQRDVGLGEFALQTSGYGYSEQSRNWAIERRENMGPVYSIKERLNHALTCIKESHKGGDILVQIWVPVKRGDKQVLITSGQPFSLDQNCQRLINYRNVSTAYHFSAEVNSDEALGLPGRVFVGKVPEWTPDVRLFSSHEYPRVNDAQRFDVRGSLALPVFERGSRSCLGVVEVVMTTEKINYSSDLENICNALQAVDLSSSEVLSIPHVKVRNDSYRAALPEISEVLRVVCETHKLPLAQTWIPCAQQGKIGSRHSNENYKDCVSTVDGLCYVNDKRILGFHVACAEHHLFKGQGVAGKAFTTNQPCYSSDVTASSKLEYPLSHHAKMFNLRGAVAIRLRSVHTGTADFVLEFFLPIDCINCKEQKLMLNSLSSTIQQVCWSLRVVTAKELEEEAVFNERNLNSSQGVQRNQVYGDVQKLDREEMLTEGVDARPVVPGVEPSWIASIVEAQKKGKIPAVELEFEKQNIAGFSVTPHWDNPEVVLPAGKIFSDLEQNQLDLATDSNECGDPISGEPRFSKSGKETEKKRAKTEKTISLQVLRQYFAGSLKDAAKNLGVCPTTLKRICRQHGITRWPSRKIKKVDHSLRKLQVVIDSVQGVEGAFQFSSLYANFPEPPKSDLIVQNLAENNSFSALKQGDQPESLNAHKDLFGLHDSPSSSCSQSSSSSQSCSSGAKQSTCASQVSVKGEPIVEENQNKILKRSHSEVELHPLAPESHCPLPRTYSNASLGKHPSPGTPSPLHQETSAKDFLRVKAVYGEEKVRFRLQPSWGFQDLKQEIAKRFSITNSSSMNLKYLDDDSEWVLLTCDADLVECVDIYKSSHTHTVKISVHHVAQPQTIGSLGSSGLS